MLECWPVNITPVVQNVVRHMAVAGASQSMTGDSMDEERPGKAYEGDIKLTVVGQQLHPGDRAPDFRYTL